LEKTTLEYANEYYQKHLSCIPLRSKSKKPSISSWEEYKKVPAGKEQIKSWFSNGHANDNIAIVTGKVSGIIAFDIDGQDARTHFEKVVEDMEDGVKNPVKNTMQIKTGGGNIHILIGFRPEEFAETELIKNPLVWSGVEKGGHNEIRLKAEGGYIVAPPSIHPNGKRYELVNKVEALTTLPKVQINTLISALTEPDRNKTDTKEGNRTKDNKVARKHRVQQYKLEDKDISDIVAILRQYYREGARNDIVMYLSGWMRKEGIEYESVRKLIESLAETDEEIQARLRTLDETYEKQDLEKICGYSGLLNTLEQATADSSIPKNILNKIFQIIRSKTNDSAGGNNNYVMMLTDELMNEYAFKTIKDNEEIYYYDFKRGVYTQGGEWLIKEQCEILYPEVRTHNVQEVINHIKRRTGVIRSKFDSDSLQILNLQNGLLNIQTGEFREHSPNHLSLIQLPVSFNENAKCPQILKFLGQVLHPQDVFTALQIFGYCLYKSAVYEKAVMLVGPGSNCKGVFIKLVEALVGLENTSHASLQDLDKYKYASADLYCKMVNTFADLKADKLTSTGMFKTLVSGDSIRAQRKYGQPFSFRNVAKLIFSANKIPDSEDKSYAYYRRWVILPFDNLFEGESKDTSLINKLTTPEELSGLLNLALIALRQLHKNGGFKNVAVEKIRKEYEENSNTVKVFLEDKCVVDLTAPEYYTLTTNVYNEYLLACKEKGEKPLEMNVFGKELAKQGIVKERSRGRAGDREYYYIGVKLRSELRGQNQTSLSA
jgi:P4 family phage/plasmid primase-like protien